MWAYTTATGPGGSGGSSGTSPLTFARQRLSEKMGTFGRHHHGFGSFKLGRRTRQQLKTVDSKAFLGQYAKAMSNRKAKEIRDLATFSIFLILFTQ